MGESERLDELYKYFPTVYDRDSNVSTTASAVTLCSDPILNALAQLGACRLDTERAFVSLIDHENQYVVAEAIRKGSLFDATCQPDAGGLAVGVRTLDLVSGICASTIPIFSDTTGDSKISNGNMFADTTRFIVNDLSLEPKYSTRSCVRGFPYMRFYASAAIRSSSGHVIGNFAAIDSRPHSGLTEEGQLALVEIATSVMKHLELLKVQKSHDSALQLLHGLETFVRHETSVESNKDAGNKSRPSQNPSSPSTKKSSAQNSNNSQPQKSTGSPEVATPAEQQSVKDQGDTPTSNSGEHALQTSKPVGSNHAKSSQNPAPTAPSDKGLPSQNRYAPAPPDEHQDVLTRASSLIRAAMQMDRVFFIKAPNSSSLSKSRNSSTAIKILDTADLSAEVQQNIAAKSGLTVNTEGPGRAGSEGDITENLTISEELHQDLLSQHPRGAFFNFTNYSRPDEHDSDAKAALFRSLRSSLPPARSLLFQPLFGPDNRTSARSMFAWSSGEKRVLQQEDLNSFRLFSAAIEAKFSQIETAIQSRAKSDFISSISHELRSPLHGILGNAELLSHSNLDPDQEESILMIQKSGGALLTTLDHVLTYSKINTRTRLQLLSSNLNNDKDGVTNSIDLSMVVEDSVDTLISGNHFRKLAAMGVSGGHNKSDDKVNLVQQESNSGRRGPLINLTIDAAPTWSVVTEEAVWVRSVINILGNAMKYTERGAIEVRLQMNTRNHSQSGVPTHTVKLSVSDTGRGMSSTYLQNHLYHAFSQENTTSDGLGLGLSIVKKLVEGLDGSIDIESTVGKGTVVEISAPITFQSKEPVKEPAAPLRFQGKRICLLGKLYRQHVDPGHNSVQIPHQHEIVSMESTLSKYCEQWYGMEVSHSAAIDQAKADVIVILEEDLPLVQGEFINKEGDGKQLPACGIVVVSTMSDAAKRTGPSKNDGMFYILPPFGPRRLGSILRQALDYTRKTTGGTPGPLSRPTSNVTSISDSHKNSVPSRMKNGSTQSAQDGDGASTEKHVLVVDDNEINVKLLCKILAKWEIPYETASNGAEAVDTFQNSGKTFEYVLMDISMPVMNGIVATRTIREFETSREGFPKAMIIAMTGLGDEKTQREAVASGMDMFLTKPIRLGQIKSILNIS